MKLHKKFLVNLLAVAALLLCAFALPEKAQAASASDVIFKLNSAGDGYVVSDYRGSISGALEIPATYKGLPVTEIGSEAFRECETLTSVVIPYGVKKIGWSAFCECTALTSVTIPNSVTTIENGAFAYCSSLTSLTIPASVTKLGTDIFSRCSVLNDLCVEQGNSVYHSAGNCIIETATKTLVAGCNASKIPNDGSVIKIGSYAFSECTRMESITIPNGVTHIGTYAFYNCQSLTSITIPTSVTSIDGWAFYSCRGLNTVTIPQGVTSIGYCAFYECRNLTRVVIPNSVTSIGASAFSSCNNLDSVVYCGTQEQWKAVRKDTNALFSYGTVLKYHSYTNGVCGYCQECDPGILTFELNETADGYIVSDCPQTASGNLTIPATYNGLPITAIGARAFYDCRDLLSVDIPDSVTSIGNGAFSGCVSVVEFIIPERVTSIATSAFLNCPSLTSIIIPSSVTSMGDSVFLNCTSLTRVEIAASITSIGEDVFFMCSNLTTVTIPASVTSIGGYAFYGSNLLEKVIYCGTPEQWSAVTVGVSNGPLNNATVQYHQYEEGICGLCQHRSYVNGDIDGNGVVNQDDAVYLLLHTMFGEAFYPLNNAPGDIDGNGKIEQDDAVYLLLHTMFGEAFYPLH